MTTAFNEKQCAALQRHILKETLGKMGIVQTAPTILAIAPRSLGGFGIISIEMDQLIKHITLILLHGPDMSSTTGQLLRSTLEYHALETGLPGDPMRLPSVTYTTPNAWINNTLYFMDKYQMHINSTISGLDKWLSDDVFLMEIFKGYGSDTTMAIINKVRLHLRVVTRSDLLTADGKFYDKNIVKGKRNTINPNPSYYRYQWPEVPPPTTTEKAIWSTALIFTFRINIEQLRANHNVMGWHQLTPLYSRWTYSVTEQNLYQRLDNGKWTIWKTIREHRHHRTRLSTSSLFESTNDTVCTLPAEVYVASVTWQSSNRVHLMSTSPIADESRSSTEASQDTNDDRKYCQHTAAFQYQIAMNNGIIVTVGSYHDGISTCAWVAQPPYFTVPLKDVNFSDLLWYSDFVQGLSEEQNSYRAELGGILKAVVSTNRICNQVGLTSGQCTLYCDSKGALCAAFGSKRPTPRWSSFDLVRRIRDALHKSPITWKFHHVKGHQDDTYQFQALGSIAQGNVIVDFLASQQLSQGTRMNTIGESWTLYVNGRQQCGNIDRGIMNAVFQPIMIAKWTKLFRITPDQASQCDWTLFFCSHSVHHKFRVITLIKYNARLLPVGSNLKRRRHSDTSQCFHCEEDETHEHLVQCFHPELTSLFEDLMVELYQWLQDYTSDSIAKELVYIARYFRTRGQENIDITITNDRVRTQISLGLRDCYGGLWTVHWSQEQ